MKDLLENPKYTVSVRIRKHCTGCGLDFHIETLHEPQCFEHHEIMVDLIRVATSELLKASCPSCKSKKAKQVDWWPA